MPVAKTLDRIWQEPPKELLDNIVKQLKFDTGGTPGAVPAVITKIVKKIKELPQSEAEILLMRRDNDRGTAMRVGAITRTEVLKCKLDKLSLQQYKVIVAKKLAITESNKRKKPIRQLLCGI